MQPSCNCVKLYLFMLVIHSPFFTTKTFKYQFLCKTSIIQVIVVGKINFGSFDLVSKNILNNDFVLFAMNRSSRPEVIFGKDVLNICSSKLTGEHPCRSVISIKSLCNFIEITLRYGCFLAVYFQNTIS